MQTLSTELVQRVERRPMLMGNSVLCAGLALLTGGVAVASAQDLATLGILVPGSSSPAESVPLALFLADMIELGYEDGRTIKLEIRAADGDLERLPGLARDLVALEPDVIWAYSAGAANAIAQATSTIPIVVGPVNEDALASLVQSFSHPGGNLTGVTLNNLQQHEKCLQLLKEMVPAAARVAILLNPANATWSDYPAALAPAAQLLGIELVRVDVLGEDDLERAVDSMSTAGIDAVLIPADASIATASSAAGKLAELLIRRRIPSVTDSTVLVRAGALLALTPDVESIARAAATDVDRILRGATPAELPIERPTVVRVVLNLETARRLSLTLPPAILLRADETIE